METLVAAISKASSIDMEESNRYEKILESFDSKSGENASCFAEASRKTRREAHSRSPRDKEVSSVCSGVAGPVLCGYVLWIIQKSVEMGLERLYFISRDGELLLKIAQCVTPAFWPGRNLDLRYLLGSRQAWHLPALTANQETMTSWVLSYFENSSLKTALSRVNLRFEDCQDKLTAHGFTVEDWERRLSRGDRNQAEALIRDPFIQDRMATRAGEATEPALGYLEQEGLFEPVRYGLVDLGWSGRTKGSLESLLLLRGKAPAPFFFFGRRGEKSKDDNSVLHAYLYNVRDGIHQERQLPDIEALMESFCTSLDSGLVSYRREGDRFMPVYRESSTQELQAWGYQVMRDSILGFTNNLVHCAPGQGSPPRLPAATGAALLKAFWRFPTRSEALIWGQFPFEEDLSGASRVRLIPQVKLGPPEFWRLFLHNRAVNHDTVWEGGLLAVNSRLFGLVWCTTRQLRKWAVSFCNFFLRRDDR